MNADAGILTPQNVEGVFIDCLFQDGEDTTDHIIAEGIVLTVGFHPGRIEENRQEIHDMLAELPDEFKVSGGGGHSFLEARLDRHGNQWTSSDRAQEQLVQLGIAIGEVEYFLPRESWRSYPFGMPYFMVKQ